MTEARIPTHTGGCQCGAVRFAVYVQPAHSVICHCRMCQKAFGSFFSPFTGVPHSQFAWTRGAPALYASSQLLQRGFCGKCGTPLSCQTNGADEISLATGSFDHPEKLPPTFQAGIESRMPWFSDMPSLRGKTTGQLMPQHILDGLENHQHPDCEVPEWLEDKR